MLLQLLRRWYSVAVQAAVRGRSHPRHGIGLESGWALTLWSSLRVVLLSCHLLEKAMAPHSSTLAWKIPQTGEPGRLQSTGSLRVGHDWATSLSLFTFMHWRRKWQPTPVFLPGKSQKQGSLVGCRLWGCTELDTTEVTAAAACHLQLKSSQCCLMLIILGIINPLVKILVQSTHKNLSSQCKID